MESVGEENCSVYRDPSTLKHTDHLPVGIIEATEGQRQCTFESPVRPSVIMTSQEHLEKSHLAQTVIWTYKFWTINFSERMSV